MQCQCTCIKHLFKQHTTLLSPLPVPNSTVTFRVVIYNCTAISKQFVARGYLVDYTIEIRNQEFCELYAFRILCTNTYLIYLWEFPSINIQTTFCVC